MRLLDSAMLSNSPQHHMREERRGGPRGDTGKRRGCRNPWAPSLPHQQCLLKEDLETAQSFGGRNLGEVRAGAGFCKRKSPINPFRTLKLDASTFRYKETAQLIGQWVDRKPLTQINYGVCRRCTRARQTWPKMGWDNDGMNERMCKVSWEVMLWCAILANP